MQRIELKDLQNDLNQVAIDVDSGKISPEEAKTRINEIVEVLNRAIEDSKSVDQVNSLTNDILNILVFPDHLRCPPELNSSQAAPLQNKRFPHSNMLPPLHLYCIPKRFFRFGV